jgi:hypothetical protein
MRILLSLEETGECRESGGGIKRAIVAGGFPPPVPSPLYAGERVRVRGRVPNQHGKTRRAARARPLTPALSPEYRGEGVRVWPFGVSLM